MHRLLSISGVAAVAVGLLVPSASAAPAPQVSYKGLPEGWSAQAISCDSGQPSPGSVSHVNGPSTPPAGSGSLKVSVPASSVAGIGLDFPAGTDLSTLQAFSASVYLPSVAETQLFFSIDATDGTLDYSLAVAANAAKPNQWQSVDAATATLHWEATNAQGGSVGSGSSTLANFVSAHPGLKLEDVSIIGGACGPAEAIYIDALTLTAGTIDTTIDFEAPLPSALANFSRPTTVPMGSVVTLGARLTSSSAPLDGQIVSLYARGAGSNTYALVKSLTTNSTGGVSMKVAVNRTTSFQWRYSGASTGYAPVNAPAFTIVSRQRIAVTTKPTSASYGTNAVLKGRITPNRGGVTVRLVRLVNGHRIVVANAKTVYGGYFTIKAPMKVRGTSTYLVSALPYPGQDLGQSATFKITTK